MIWQDIVLMVGSFIFSIALIPTVRGKDKPALSTSLLTSGVLSVFVICFFTLGLYLAAISGILTTIMWVILALQAMRLRGSK